MPCFAACSLASLVAWILQFTRSLISLSYLWASCNLCAWFFSCLISSFVATGLVGLFILLQALLQFVSFLLCFPGSRYLSPLIGCFIDSLCTWPLAFFPFHPCFLIACTPMIVCYVLVAPTSFHCVIFPFYNFHTSWCSCNSLVCFPIISIADLLTICFLASFLSYSQTFLHAAFSHSFFLNHLISCNMLPNLLCRMQAFLWYACMLCCFPTPCFLLSRLFPFFHYCFSWLISLVSWLPAFIQSTNLLLIVHICLVLDFFANLLSCFQGFWPHDS